MKVISGIFQFFAVILLIVVVLSLPFALFMRNLGSILFSPEKIIGLVDENVLDAHVMANIAVNYMDGVDTLGGEGGEENPYDELILEAMKSLDEDDWHEIFSLIAPPRLIIGSFEQIMHGFYDWIDSPDVNPEIVIDLRPWRSNLETHSTRVLEIFISKLPLCTEEEMAAFTRIVDSSGEAVDSVPMCKPAEPLFSDVIEIASTYIPAQIASMPAELDFGEQMAEGDGNLRDAKQTLAGVRIFLRTGWLAIVFLLIIAIPMGARSFQGLMRWLGWPLILSGALVLLLGFSLLMFTETLLSGMGAFIFDQVPAPFLPPVEAIAAAFLISLAQPTLVQAAILVILGGGCLVGAVLVGSDSDEVQQYSAQQPQPASQTQAAPQPIQPPPARGEEDDIDDDSRPTGMFG